MQTFDVRDEILSHEAYLRVRDAYWVLAFADRDAYPDYWLFGVGEEPPPPVPNKQMSWRRPTYEEARERQECLTDPDRVWNGEWAQGHRWRSWYGAWRAGLFPHRREYAARTYLRDHGVQP